MHMHVTYEKTLVFLSKYFSLIYVAATYVWCLCMDIWHESKVGIHDCSMDTVSTEFFFPASHDGDSVRYMLPLAHAVSNCRYCSASRCHWKQAQEHVHPEEKEAKEHCYWSRKNSRPDESCYLTSNNQRGPNCCNWSHHTEHIFQGTINSEFDGRSGIFRVSNGHI